MNLILYQLQRADCASDDEFESQTKAAVNHFLIQQLEALGITEDLARLPGYWAAQGYELHCRHQAGYPLAEVHRIRDQDLLEVVYGGGQVSIHANHPDLPPMVSDVPPAYPWATPQARPTAVPEPSSFRPATPVLLNEQDTLHVDPNPTGAQPRHARDTPNAYGHARDAEGRLYALGPDWPDAWGRFWRTERVSHSFQRPVDNPTYGIATFRIGPVADPEADS